MERLSIIKRAAFAAVAAFGLFSGAGTAMAGHLDIGIGINISAPPPPQIVVSVPAPVVTVDYNTYVVGFRANLYDADWRLRQAQNEQCLAQEALDAARHREGEIAVTVDEQEGIVAQFGKQVADSDAALAAARAAVGTAAADAQDARVRLTAFEHRVESARSDLDAARTLHDGPGAVDAENRLRTNEAGAAGAAGDLHAAEARMADLQAAEQAAAALNDARVRFVDAQAQLPKLRDDLAAAHGDVFAAQQRLDAAIGAVALALHDRDEALWLLHRDDIFAGRFDFGTIGFHIDLGVWGGHLPSDPEVLHAYFVHPVAYWVDRPVEIETRIIEVDHVTDLVRIRDVERVHEGPRYQEVAAVESRFPVEQRRAFAEHVVVERQRFAAERTERAAAAAEHRAPRIDPAERAEAKAIVMQAHANAKATEMEAHADAKATEMQAHANAKATEMTAHADAKATEMQGHANAKATEMQAHANAKATEMNAHADAKATETTAHANAKATETTAHGNAKATETTAHANAKATETTAHASAKATETQAHADAKGQEAQAHASARPGSTPPSASSDPRHNPAPGKAPTADSRGNPRDPRNKPRDGQASVAN